MKTKVNAGIIVFLLSLIMLTAVTSCSANSTDMPGLAQDREGNPITLPQTIDKIISMGPSNTEILAALGCADKIIATDTYSENVAGIKSGLPVFSMMAPDGEQIINLQPDVIFVTGMSKADGDDLFKVVQDAGICVIYIPSAESIDNIKEDIRYMAAVMGAESKSAKIISDMEQEINAIKKIGAEISDKKSVYFEISAPPYLMGVGNSTFLHEMIELIGARNVLGNQEKWIYTADEAIIHHNPDVILTSVNYIENPVNEIISRPGWNEIKAVKNSDVYYIDTDASNNPSHNIVKALKEMAKVIYPDKY